MAKKLQLRRGTTSQHSSFTGAVGEVTVDTDKDVIVVHDGSTAGGFPAVKSGTIALADLAADCVDGTKIADDSLNSEHYVDGSIDLAHLSADCVDGTKIADDAINSEHYVDGSIDLAHLSADCVDGTKIADDSINSEHYVDGSIDLAHLAADCIDGTKIADDSLNSEHYVDGSIDLAHLSADCVDGTKIADDSLDSEHYVDGSIDDAHLASGISSSKISGAVTNIVSHGLGTSATVDTGTSANQIVKLDGNAKIPAVDGSQLTNLPASGKTITESTNPPALTTNPSDGVGALYLDKNLGELYCCTDACLLYTSPSPRDS